MFRRVEPDGRTVWYLGPQVVYALLGFVLVVMLLWELMPDWTYLDDEQVVNVYSAVYESRINAIVRDAARQTVTSAKTVTPARRKTLCPHEYDYNITDIDDKIQVLKERPVSSLHEIANHHVDVMGGAWKPRDCRARHRVAIVIPYRDRKEHLLQVLSVLLPFLKAQNLQFRIYLPEQNGSLTFNKGVLMNAAFLEALRDEPWDCFVFHDVDLVPESPRILYSCPAHPRHLSAAIDEFDYVLPYEELVGGVFILKTEHFVAANGYSNMFWGWGAEDDDMYKRIRRTKFRVIRQPYSIARYHQIKHTKRQAAVWKIRYKNLRTTYARMRHDGVNSVKYNIVSRKERKLFTHLLIDVGKPPEPS